MALRQDAKASLATALSIAFSSQAIWRLYCHFRVNSADIPTVDPPRKERCNPTNASMQ